jgi:hypothetical protein
MKIRIRNDEGCDLNETVWEGELKDNIVLELHIGEGVLELWEEEGELAFLPQDSRRRKDPGRLGYWENPDMLLTIGRPSKLRLRHDIPKEVP